MIGSKIGEFYRLAVRIHCKGSGFGDSEIGDWDSNLTEGHNTTRAGVEAVEVLFPSRFPET